MARVLAALAATLLALAGTAAAAIDARLSHGLEVATADLHGVRVLDGERVVITVNRSGEPSPSTRGPAQPGWPPAAPAGDDKVETVYAGRVQGALTAPADTLVATFRRTSGGAVLSVENGFSHPVIYDASVIHQDGDRISVTPTTICPVRAKGFGIESWDPAVVGVIISKPREPPNGNLGCSGDTGLTAADLTIEPNVCQGGSADAPLQVELYVDPTTGARTGARAIWMLHDPSKPEGFPQLRLLYPMQKADVGGRPEGGLLMAVAPLNPRPTAKSAAVVLVADGREAARRPWEMFAQAMSQQAPTKQGYSPEAFVGLIPLPMRHEDGSADPQLAPLYAAIGDGSVKTLAVRIEGDDGSLISQGSYPMEPVAVRDSAAVAVVLAEAERKAAEPGHCARPKPPH